MTTIAWDGTTLAADKRSSSGSAIGVVTKISRLSDGSLFGASGDFASAMAMREWIERGAIPADFPTSQRDKDTWARTIVIRREGYLVYEMSPQPLRFEGRTFSTGSGMEYALAAMHCGKTAAEAVEIAAIFDVHTGNGVDTLTL